MWNYKLHNFPFHEKKTIPAPIKKQGLIFFDPKQFKDPHEKKIDQTEYLASKIFEEIEGIT